MTLQRLSGWIGGAVLAALVLPSAAPAGYFLGEWSWHWHPDRNCPRGTYSPLHYWTPEVYKARACLHPSNLDQYAPGPCPTPPLGYEINRYRCLTTPPAPTTPYADPAGYYGLPPATGPR
jgi:hypothetical protein